MPNDIIAAPVTDSAVSQSLKREAAMIFQTSGNGKGKATSIKKKLPVIREPSSLPADSLPPVSSSSTQQHTTFYSL